MAKLNDSRRARTGQKVEPELVRKHCVSVRLDDAELAFLESKRGKLRRGEWLRMAALDNLPQPVPEANLDLSLSLSKLLGALGALMVDSKMDYQKTNILLDIRAETVKLRKALEGKNK